MTTFSRRKFLGAASAMGLAMTPALAFPNIAGAGQSPAPAPTGNAKRALESIQQRIAAWEQEGRAFKSDGLAADNDAQWDRLVEHYFDRSGYTSISVNSANLCPSMRPVDQMVTMVQQMLNQDISFPMRAQLAQASLGLGLESVKEWFGLGGQKYQADFLLALVANSTEGNNFINNGLVSSGFFNPEKDNVVVWDVNHPTNLDAWFYRKATQGWGAGSIRTLKTKMLANSVSDAEKRKGVVPSDPKSEDEIIEALLHVVDKNTKLVTLSWQSNECGMLLPMGRIVHELRKINKDMYIHADSAQTFGVLDLKLGEVDVDSIAGSFHKWPCGPKMVGIVYMNNKRDAASKFTPSIWGYDEHIMTPMDYGFDPEKGQMDPNAKRFSYLGQQNDATLVSTWMVSLFHTGNFHPNVTPAKIEDRVHQLGTKTKEALFRRLPKIFPDFTPKTAYKWITTPTTNDALRSSVFLFTPPKGVNGGDVMKNVYEQHGFAIANLKVLGHDLVRISPTFCNMSQDPEDVVAAVVDVIQAMQQHKLANNTHARSYA